MPILIMMFCLMMCVRTPEAFAEPKVELQSDVLYQGDTALIRISAEKGQQLQVTWMNYDIILSGPENDNRYTGFIFADLEQDPGEYIIDLSVMPSGYNRQISIRVEEKNYGVRRLTLPEDKVDLSAENLERALAESAVMRALWDAPDTAPEWTGPFILPVDSDVTGPFGRRTVINDQPRAPHSGVDLRGKRGTPVKAANAGRVVLTADQFFTGKSIVLDHGGGIRSMYFHLHEIMVNAGDRVSKGSVIGLVGSTGRSTGPHLHWGIRIRDARIDPIRLIEETANLEE